MFLNQRGFGDADNDANVQSGKILLNHTTTSMSNAQVSATFSGRRNNFPDNFAGLVARDTNTVNSIIMINSSQGASPGQKLHKIDTNAQSVALVITQLHILT